MYRRQNMKDIPVYTPVDVVTSGSVIHNVKPSGSYHNLPRTPKAKRPRVALAAWESLLNDIASKKGR